MGELDILMIEPNATSSTGNDVMLEKSKSLHSFFGSSLYLPGIYESDLNFRFRVLKEKWEEDTKYGSKTFSKTDHPAYLEILDFGERIIPVLINDMTKNKTHWFFALNELTGENPVKSQHRGRIDEMIGDWVSWGKEIGII